MKIHLGMPTYMGVHPETVRNIVQFDLESQDRKNDLTLHFPQTFSLSYSRNIIMKAAVEDDAEWVIMWDSDIQVKEKEFFEILLKTAYDKDAVIVGVPCRLRYGDKVVLNCGYRQADKYENLTAETCPKEPAEIDAIGTGLMLINLNWVKKNWPKGPWFDVIYTEAGMFPEDWTFCERVKERGGKVVVEPRIKTVHWGMIGYAT